MSGTVMVYLCGVHSLGFAIFHAFFWRIFDWKNDLKTSSVSTRAIIQISNLRLIHVFLLSTVLCFWLPDELLSTKIGQVFLAGMALFWLGRTLEQFILLPYNQLFIHVLTALFALGALLFTLPLLT
ncbi:hypothetical protein IC229_28740 [Spirosoma sp. BT702]|uniref:Uncharacterized protein n=1 Tax=Spirosoma profusum TaxID=2771354 RepID=A0A926Y107_9BACT|nr:hypothetical protein [Spirosoma profusum]MBD2704659.1 hypothetical protein [Spirosoma profusum]